MPTRIAVIGAGLIGRKHLGILKEDPAFEVAGIADPAPQAEAYARANGFPYFKETEALLDTAKPDGVVIANPNALHRETALACIARKIPAIVEKPVADTLADARAIVAKYNLTIDDAVRRALDNSANESCKPGDTAFARATFELIAKPKASLEAAVKVARDAGYEVIALGADLEGEAREVAAGHARMALKARSEGKRLAILSGGELTVTVRGNGRGGPNQEYALALADLLKDTPDIAALAADTDGADGGAGSASDPAGAMIDAATFAKIKSLGLDPRAYLENNDATGFFSQTGDLLQTGPTLTNVNDIRAILVD